MARVSGGISLEQWELKTQLTENELQSVYDLQDACEELPLPTNWISSSPALAKSSSGVRTPDSFSNAALTSLNAGALSSRLTALTTRPRSSTNLLVETTAAVSEFQTRSAHGIGSDKPIETLQQFFDWFANMEPEMEKDQEDVYRNYLSVVSLYRESCDEFLSDLKATAGLFDELDSEYGYVEKRTRSLQTACEKLLNEQERLVKLADALAERLAYFNQLEAIAKLFNSPGDDVCLHPDFVPMLQKLDECIEYMQQHLKYRDAELYLMRFRQCMTRGMTVIKMYLITTIKSLGYDIYTQTSSNSADQPLALSKQTTLFYVKFRMISSTVKPLSIELEKRCEGHKEYQSLYQDTLNAYFQTRQNLLGPVISRKTQELGPYGDLLAFARNGCAYMMNLCMDEFNLFYNFFRSGDDELYSFLDLLTSYLYDHLRPRIIHENNISVLSELCSIFQMYVLRDETFTEGDHSDNDSRPKLEFGHLIQNVLEDSQGRLVFRAQTYIDNDIQKYQPKQEDYEIHAPPDNSMKTSIVLEGSKANAPLQNTEIPATLPIEEDTQSDTQSMKDRSEKQNLSVSTSDSPLGQGTDSTRGWFPTLQKTLWILSKLYHCVQTVVFEDLAQDAVSLCNESLRNAAETITAKKSRLDGQLFLIKHLLVLKEQLAPFEANLIHSGKALDFSHVTDTLSSFQQNRSLIFNPNALIGLAQTGMPRVVEISLDSRRDIDRELKRVCEDFITDCALGAAEPLTNFMIKVSTARPANVEVRDQSFTNDARETADQFMESTGERIRFVLKKFREYVNDHKIEQILMKPIQANILDQYKAFIQTVETDWKIQNSEDPFMSVEAMAVWLSQLKDQLDELPQ
ncbi:Sec34-like family-domain-containing protein [Zychaea mexicana]|uniref:Sec34-like family-domain-containing protein n=1 Tax=Zychaea mexicana TaxID=64656 RepID=UPI0022FEBD6E|nr:Sec34-like family-domain-containing protein [Zychaea mexicana]KAI9489876.1 Sec34-like family-domain-containing protein [Zychaea mexicana]